MAGKLTTRTCELPNCCAAPPKDALLASDERKLLLNLERPGSVTQIVHMRDFKFVLRPLKVPQIDAVEISPDLCPKLRIPQDGETDDLIGQS